MKTRLLMGIMGNVVARVFGESAAPMDRGREAAVRLHRVPSPASGLSSVKLDL